MGRRIGVVVRTPRAALAVAALALALVAARAEGEPPAASLEVVPGEATVGDELDAILTLDLPEGARFPAVEVGPALGPFAVLSGGWSEAPEGGAGGRWTWRGRIAAYKTGTLTVPPVRLEAEIEGERRVIESAPLEIRIRSVLDESGEAEIADLKPPATIEPDYRPLVAAAAGFVLLLALSGLLWWLHRRYASRLAAVRREIDPFERTPPHVWVYAELQRLLDLHLPDRGEVERFFEELARILKRYLGGRYRVDLLERTTHEVAPALVAAGATPEVGDDVERLLERCDHVKFARARPDVDACRAAVEEVYRIVDRTKPAGAAADPERGAA